MSNLKSKISKPQSLRVLMVEDSEDDALLIIRELKKGSYAPEYERVETASAMLTALKDKTWDIILSDYKMPHFSGTKAIAVLKETNIDIPVIIVSGTIGEETAIECMRLGAHDYIMKNNLSRLCPAIARELEEATSRSKRKQAEEALRQSEERYRTILDEMEDGYFEVDLAGNFTFVNDADCRLLGHSREELIGASFKGHLNEEDFDILYNAFGRIYSTGKPERGISYRAIRKDGITGFAEVAGFPLQNQKGEIIGFRGIAQDITDRKRLEEALRESEKKYRLLADNIDDVIFILDMNLNYTYVSPSVKILMGYEPEELLKQPPIETMTPFSWDLVTKTLSEIIELEKSGNGEISISEKVQLEMRRKDGTTVWTEVNASFIRDENHRPVSIMGVARDITERKQAEEALRALTSRQEAILAAVPEIIVEVDNNKIYAWANLAGIEFFGEDVIGKEAAFYFEGEQEIYDNVSPLFNGVEDIVYVESLQRRKDGEKRLLAWWCRVLKDKSGQVTGALSSASDITERKLLKEKLVLNLEIQAAMNILLGLSLEGRPVKEFLYSALDLVLSLKWLAIESKGAVFLTDKAGETLLLQVQKGLSKELCAMCSTVPFGHCLCGRAAVARSVQFADRVDERHDTHYEGMPPHGHYCIPILSGDHILGVIVLYVKEGHTRSPWEENFLKAVANSLAGTIERRRMEEASRESEEKYRLIAENTADLIIVTDMNLRFTYISPSIMRTHGFTVEEAMNMTLDQFLTPGSRQNLLTVFEEEMKLEATGTADPKRIRRLEIEGYKKDGSIIWMEISVSNQRDKEYKPIGILAVNRDITERKQAEDERQQSFERMRKALRATVQSISMIVEMKDPYTSGHQQRVADLARSIATEMGLSADRQDFIRTASSIHDIGKIAVPAEILSKPTKLTDLEFGLIKTHSQSGYDILKNIEFPWPVADVVLQHHERMDGSGYPHGLKGENISLEARILAVADVVEAIASHRPYRPAPGIDVALEEISRNRGIFYDADAVDACLRLFREKGYTLVFKK